MILAFDTYYFDTKAKTVAIAFNQWSDQQPEHIYSETIPTPAAYEPGAFYKRELPCILSLLDKINQIDLETIIIDGYVVVDNLGKPGLGGHLYEHLNKSIPVIGVAKSDFVSLTTGKMAVLRGTSTKPLYISSLGIDTKTAGRLIWQMHGDFRIPTLLSLLDQETKKTDKGD